MNQFAGTKISDHFLVDNCRCREPHRCERRSRTQSDLRRVGISQSCAQTQKASQGYLGRTGMVRPRTISPELASRAL